MRESGYSIMLLQFVVIVRGVVDRLKLQLRSVESDSVTQKESGRERLARTHTHTETPQQQPLGHRLDSNDSKLPALSGSLSLTLLHSLLVSFECLRRERENGMKRNGTTKR